jgi:hypothetical protein
MIVTTGSCVVVYDGGTNLLIQFISSKEHRCRTICRSISTSTDHGQLLREPRHRNLASAKILQPSSPYVSIPNLKCPHIRRLLTHVPWLSRSSAVSSCTPMLYTRSCRPWRWGCPIPQTLALLILPETRYPL